MKVITSSRYLTHQHPPIFLPPVLGVLITYQPPTLPSLCCCILSFNTELDTSILSKLSNADNQHSQPARSVSDREGSQVLAGVHMNDSTKEAEALFREPQASGDEIHVNVNARRTGGRISSSISGSLIQVLIQNRSGSISC